MDSIQIWHVLVTGFQGVPYFKVTLNSHVLKGYIEFTLLSPACGRGWEIIKRLPSLRPSVRSSRFCINLNISFIYKDISTKFAGNVYGYGNLSLQHFSLILKNKMAAIANCLKIIKVL